MAAAGARVHGDRRGAATRLRERWASASTGPGPLSVVLGTSGVVFAALPEYRPEPEARLHVFCHAVPDTWHAMGVMLSAAGSLQWLHDALGRPPYEELLAEAERWEPGDGGPSLPAVPAGRAHAPRRPGCARRLRRATLRHDRGALTRAVLEGVAYGLRDSLELLRELGVEAEVGRVSGGGARSELWLKIVASVLGLPLERTTVDEGAAYGAALLGGVREGVFADAHEAVEACVRVSDRIEPDPGWQAVYEEGYARYRVLYPRCDLCRASARRNPFRPSRRRFEGRTAPQACQSSEDVADTLAREQLKLYGLPQAEFTAARNARAKELRKDDPELAATVAALPNRPPQPPRSTSWYARTRQRPGR